MSRTRRPLLIPTIVLVVAALVATGCGGTADSADPANTTDEPGSPQTTPNDEDAPRDDESEGDEPGDDQPEDGEDGEAGTVQPVALAVAERQESDGDPAVAGAAISRFGTDLLTAARSTGPEANLNLSPASVAIALAMVEPGAVGESQTQLRAVLGIDDPGAYHAAMNAMEQELERREPSQGGADGDPGELTVRVANAAYLQRGYPFEPAYLDTVGTNYGAVLNEVDFSADPDAVARTINDFVAEETNQRITDLLPPGFIDPATVLALVNALYLNASWLQPFDADQTTDGPFTLADGEEISVALMTGASDTSARGDGWIGATKHYVGGLSAQFILPDDGRFDDVADDLNAVFAEYQASQTKGSLLVAPKLDVRTNTELTDPLMALGLTAPFQPGGLFGIASDDRLVIDKVAHETVVIMDEEGTEAAAATVVLGALTSAPAVEPIPVTLDRPYLYRILDNVTGATLFIGQVMDPRP